MKDRKEFVGDLCGFDDYVNVVLENTIYYSQDQTGEYSSEDVGQILLNGTNICFLVPGGAGPTTALTR